MQDNQFLRTILVLPVRSIEESIDWYRDALGFIAEYIHHGDGQGEAANYTILKRGTAQVHLILDEPPPHNRDWAKAGTGYLYLTVRNVEAVYSELVAGNVPIDRGIETENWGARGFNLTDPSGNAVHIEEELT